MLARLARFSFRKRRIMVFAIWLPLLIGISAIGGAIGSNYHTDFNLPNSDSKLVQDALESGGNKEDAGWTAQIVFTSPNGTDDPAVKAAMEPFFAEVDKLEGVKVVSPYSAGGRRVQQQDQADLLRPAQRHPAQPVGDDQAGRQDPGARRQGRAPCQVCRSNTAASCSPASSSPRARSSASSPRS